jgi:hypothetical protein
MSSETIRYVKTVEVLKICGISRPTLFRWRERFPDHFQAITICGRNYYDVGLIQEFWAARHADQRDSRG